MKPAVRLPKMVEIGEGKEVQYIMARKIAKMFNGYHDYDIKEKRESYEALKILRKNGVEMKEIY